MEYLFKTNFYFKFKAPNSEQLNSKIEEISLDRIANHVFGWGNDNCLVDKIPLSWTDWLDFFAPSLDLLSKELKYTGGYNVSDPWLNVYTKHYHQEIHDHPTDLACVYFPDVQENFSQFYFRDRHNTDLSERLQLVLDYRDSKTMYVEPGDIMFFPGHMFHGVSPHKSDKVRKTLSSNINLAF